MKVSVSGNLDFQWDEGKPKFRFDATINNITAKDINMLVLPDDKQVGLSVQPVDAKGNPAQVQGDPIWSVADQTIATVTPIAGGGQSGSDYRATLVPADKLGTTQVNVSADADLGEGVTTITGLLDVQVVAGEAVSLQISAGTPEPPPRP